MSLAEAEIIIFIFIFCLSFVFHAFIINVNPFAQQYLIN